MYLSYYPKSVWRDTHILVSPDAGSIKRIEAYAKLLEINYVVLHKQRDYSKPGTVTSSMIVGKKEDYENRTAIIVDDIGDTMGTMCSAVNELVSHGLKDAIIVLTHGVFSGKAIENINNNPYIKEVLVSNTLPQDQNIAICPKLRVMDCSELLARSIDAIVSGKSVSQLFA
jgi:ribose-phosphate pyrophosphokinase